MTTCPSDYLDHMQCPPALFIPLSTNRGQVCFFVGISNVDDSSSAFLVSLSSWVPNPTHLVPAQARLSNQVRGSLRKGPSLSSQIPTEVQSYWARRPAQAGVSAVLSAALRASSTCISPHAMPVAKEGDPRGDYLLQAKLALTIFDNTNMTKRQGWWRASG